jgi:hypothetical protein
MRYIFIPTKEIFVNALHNTGKEAECCAEFLNFLAEQRSIKNYSIAVIPLIKAFKEKTFFKNHRTLELVKAYVEVEESISSNNETYDYFDVARINADKEPIIVLPDNIDINTFRSNHTTPIIKVCDAISFYKKSIHSF